jgi:hypothetical protein
MRRIKKFPIFHCSDLLSLKTNSTQYIIPAHKKYMTKMYIPLENSYFYNHVQY